MLTQEQAHKLFHYANGFLYWKTHYRKNRIGAIAGWAHKDGYAHCRIEGKMYLLHRLIFLMHKGYLPNEIDHINGVRHDNRIENLREVTRAQNTHNAKIRKDNASGVKGVHWAARDNRWVARISIAKTRIVLGSFMSFEEAKQAAIAARQDYHGEFARYA